MDNKSFVETEINKAIAKVEKLARAMTHAERINHDMQSEVMAFCYSTKQELKLLHADLLCESNLDVIHLIDDKLDDYYVQIVKIIGVETKHVSRSYKEYAQNQ